MRDAEDSADLERLLAERGRHLLRTAMLLAGNRHDGEDLLQAALERLIRQGHRVSSNQEGYLRRTLYNLAADGWRRDYAWHHRLRTHTKRVRTCGVVYTSAAGKRKHLCTWGIAGYPGTLFINPATYLPISYVDHDNHGGEQIDFGFLPPTRANLAKLRMTIPPGFKRA